MLLIYLFISGAVLLAGAEVNAVLFHLTTVTGAARLGPLTPPPAAGQASPDRHENMGSD